MSHREVLRSGAQRCGVSFPRILTPDCGPKVGVFPRRFGRNRLLDSFLMGAPWWEEANLHMVTTRAGGNLDGVQAGLARILTILTILQEGFPIVSFACVCPRGCPSVHHSARYVWPITCIRGGRHGCASGTENVASLRCSLNAASRSMAKPSFEPSYCKVSRAAVYRRHYRRCMILLTFSNIKLKIKTGSLPRGRMTLRD